MKRLAGELTYSQLSYQAGTYSFEVEVKGSINGDIYLIAISVALFVAVAVLAFSRCAEHLRLPHKPSGQHHRCPGQKSML